MKKEGVSELNQLLRSLEEHLNELEQAHNNNNFSEFERIKKIIKQLQEKFGVLVI